MRNHALYALAGIFVLYLGSYSVLSATGGYRFQISGRSRIVLAVADTWLWQPQFGWFKAFLHIDGQQTYQGDTLGYFYAPLILLDQRFLHPSIFWHPSEKNLGSPPRSQMHPFNRGADEISDRFFPRSKRPKIVTIQSE